MKKIELLAPAGDLLSCKTAILYGADAVYIGGQKYSLRSRASNFSREDIAEACSFARAHGAAIHVTVNEIPHEEDFDGLKDTDIYDYLDDLYFKSVDIMRELRSTKLTELSDIKHIINEMITEQEMGHLYSYSDAEYYVETAKKRYKYVDKRNQYLVNGVSHYTADYWKEYRQAHATPTPKPALEKLTPKPTTPKRK